MKKTKIDFYEIEIACAIDKGDEIIMNWAKKKPAHLQAFLEHNTLLINSLLLKNQLVTLCMAKELSDTPKLT
jgi:hypothetical protein